MAERKMPPTWKPADYVPADVYALKALAEGTANEDQQARALRWIMNGASNYLDASFRPDGQGGQWDTAFGEGRRFVGLQIAKLLNMDARALAAMEGRKNG